MNSKIFICIVCPNGCRIEAKFEEGKICGTAGAKCRRGEEYVRQELTNPKRTIATTVVIKEAALPLCSVRLTKAIPKKDIFRVMEEIKKIELTAPVVVGQVVIRHVCGLDSDVIVTKTMEKAGENS